MRAGGAVGRREWWEKKDWERFEIPMGREIWFQNTVVSEFPESQKLMLCNSSEGGGKEGGGEKEGVCSSIEKRPASETWKQLVANGD